MDQIVDEKLLDKDPADVAHRPQSTTPEYPPRKKRSWATIGAIAIAATILSGASYAYWRYTEFHPSTADGYVGAKVVRIAALVTGRVTEVTQTDFAEVKAGDVLLRIDPAPFEAALRGANARLALAQQQARAAEAEVAAANANVTKADVELKNTKKETARIMALVATGDAPGASGDEAEAKLRAAEADAAASRAALKEAQANLGVAGDDNANIRAAEAAVASAKLDLAHTVVRAPVSGILGQIDIHTGSVIQEGEALFPLVDSTNWWVDANFKETDLKRIKPGAPATITLDLYPSRKMKGTVTALSPASGAAFSLLPPENATGNWVKVTQRFPVRIKVVPGKDAPPLRIGASANATIDTEDTAR